MPKPPRPACALLAALLSLPSWTAAGQPGPARGLARIDHIVVIYLENHSFDNLYGLFPGAAGIAQAPPQATRQTDLQGRIYDTLPPVVNTEHKPPVHDGRFPADLPNQPFDIGRYVPPDQKTGDLTHRFYQHQQQIDGGRMDRFAAVSDAGGLAMGYYDGTKLPLWQYARRYTLADHFFQAAFGGSFLNHMWLACACTPRHPDPPPDMLARLDDQGGLVKDGTFSPDGYAVNTVFPAQGPHPAAIDPRKLLPPLVQPTLGDRLSDKRISWAWYAGGWNDAVAGRADPGFQFHHQPYAYFQRYAGGTRDRAEHLKDGADFLAALEHDRLPAVAFYKPIGSLNEHPGYADLLSGERHIADILGKIERGKFWPRTLVIVTYDEYGGFWDHVPPPMLDRWGPGSRIPALIVSPFAKRGHVDSTVYNTTSILKLIETRFGLAPLGERDAKAQSLSKALGW
ncbi:phospholipase C [Methylomagnum ishizawai]|uniref:Phospholipase C n=1 Tax=Methylomagnum ishizawai TaxID=1760988 RepID=A0A1Y6CYR9_9GAMM|nr:alkaline phosphatase family protein [Methylomagnum ishizawai]SMF93703.1 phospholipase C [Methylomagnum ishizawai]